MRKTFFLLLAVLLPAGALFAQNKELLGFSPEAAARQLALESQFDARLNKDNLDTWMKYLAGQPHHVGSPHGKEGAEYMVQLLRSWGWDAQLEEFQVLFPTPKVRVVELVSPNVYKAKLQEAAIKEDPYTLQPGQLPTYNAFSGDGDVTGELVFVNYGVPADYELLERLGISVKGKIVIAKYGGSWRGIKPKVAAEHGAIGCLIYSDPEDDGYSQGDVYPKGGYKTPSGAQRGSVLDMPVYPGDPLTPGYGATAGAKRLDRSEAVTLMKIPVLPISYEDAQPLLAALGGPVAPEPWRGNLPITYHIGPGAAKVHIKLEFNWELKPVYDVIAKLQGSEFPDQWIIRGNHHDAWVHGASDPVSGMAALLEEARVIGELAKAGQRPKRTLVYCGWDGEEPGLLGSTEWVEHHAEELKQKAVAYINSDGNERGYLGAGGSHTLEAFFHQVARDVPDPQHGVSVFERLQAAAQVRQGRELNHLELGALGSGSDFTPFIQHLGIAALNIGYGGEGEGGEYHTNFDSYNHYTRFKDPGFAYGIALAKTGGRAALRLANAEVLPFEINRFYNTVKRYADDVMKLADELRAKTERENRLIAQGAYQLVNDPNQPMAPPKVQPEVPYFNFAPLLNALERLEKAGQRFQTASSKATANAGGVNQALMQLERMLTRDEGLPKRSWFRHYVYAPGLYTGYGVKTLPGIREAIEEREFDQVEKQIGILAGILSGYAAEVERIAGKW